MSVQPDHREVAERRPMTIAQVSALLGIPVPTIRSWERRYGFPTPSRTRGRHRRYTTIEAEQLRDLRDEITRGRSARHAVDLIRRAAEVSPTRSRFSEDLIDASMGLDPTAIRNVLDSAGERLGIEATIAVVLLPTMKELGARWKAGACEIGNEHVATEGARAWLARQLSFAPPPWRGPLVMACGPGDLHSVGLEAFAVILARRGWSCCSLGPMTPVETTVSAISTTHAAGAVIVSQRNLSRRGAVGSIEAVDEIPGVRAFYAGGAFVSERNRRGVPGIYLGEDVVEAAGIIEAALEAVGGGAASRRSSMSREPARHEAGTR